MDTWAASSEPLCTDFQADSLRTRSVCALVYSVLSCSRRARKDAGLFLRIDHVQFALELRQRRGGALHLGLQLLELLFHEVGQRGRGTEPDVIGVLHIGARHRVGHVGGQARLRRAITDQQQVSVGRASSTNFHGAPLAAGVLYCLTVWYVIGCGLLLLLTHGCQGDVALFFNSIQDAFVPICCGWLLNALMLTGIMTIPGFGRSETYEFYFTRAIARRSLFRAKTMVLFAVLLGPLILNMFLALRAPDLVLKPMMLAAPMSGPSVPDPERMEGYMRAFPGAHPNASPRTHHPGSP